MYNNSYAVYQHACDAFCSCAVCYYSRILKGSFIERAVIVLASVCILEMFATLTTLNSDHGEQETKFQPHTAQILMTLISQAEKAGEDLMLIVTEEGRKGCFLFTKY